MYLQVNILRFFFRLVHFISAELLNYIVGKISSEGINQSCPLFWIHEALLALHSINWVLIFTHTSTVTELCVNAWP